MTAERWQRMQQLFQAAHELPTEARAAWLDRECHDDPSLRRDVESLLAAGSLSDHFLEQSAMSLAARGVAAAAPVLAPGDHIGPYRLSAPVGRGGMGEVWRAHDTRLGRDVALKFCDAPFTAHAAGEARAIAALNHPNICQLYDVGDGYLVMELVDGASPAGPMPLADVLRLARQVADALDAAHEKGLVHRDLKPGNIKVRPDGTVKVLDFGIATWTNARDPASPAERGALVGTPAWMSPEQLRGEHIDKRTDIWAFGLLLVTLVTGANPFARDTVEETQRAVLTGELPWQALPIEIRRLARKCLERDVNRRLRDIGDAWDLIDAPTVPVPIRSPNRLRTAALVAVVTALALAPGVWYGGMRSRAPDQSLVRLDLDLGADFPLDASGAANLVLSPDGSSIAFVSRGRLFVRGLGDAAPRQVGTMQGVQSPVFSPDGRWLAFFAQGKLRKISVNGDAEGDVSPTSAHFAGAAWGLDDTIVASLAPSGPLQVVAASGGTPRALTELDRSRGETTHRLPQFLPGGKALLFTSHNAITGFDDADIDVLTLADGRRTRVVHGGTFGRYVASGHVLYVSRGALYAVPFDAARLEVRGEPVRVADDVAYSLYGAAQFDAATSGTLVYATGGVPVGRVTLDRLDNRGGRQPLLTTPGTYLNPRVSPSGQQVLLSAREPSELALSAFDIRRDVLHPVVQYASGPSSPWAPFAVWTPDGRFVVFRGDGGMYWTRAGHSGPPQRLTTSTFSQTPAAFSPDGRTLAYYEGAGLVGPSDIWTLTIISDGSTLRAGDARSVVETSADESHPSFSRDGRWMAYASTGVGGSEVHVKAWPDDGRSWQISSSGGSQPIFSRSRDALFFLNADRQVMMVGYAVEAGAFVPDRPRRWSEHAVADVGATFWSYDVAPGDKEIVALMAPDGRPAPAPARVAVLLNAFDHLRRVAPAR